MINFCINMSLELNFCEKLTANIFMLNMAKIYGISRQTGAQVCYNLG